MVIRAATEADLAAIADIQHGSPEAAQWTVTDYLSYDCFVADEGAVIAGFLVCRSVAEDEREILNLAVRPRFRRRGIARMLLEADRDRNPAHYFLEVRASNKVARTFYGVMGFTEEGIRSRYYENPPESGIVMKRGSCYRHKCQETARGRV
jgi:ribosomal-protein-alanine N-acetyltransferase